MVGLLSALSMDVLSPAFCRVDSPARESGRLEGAVVGLCCSGPTDLSPIDGCRVGVFSEGSVPTALFSDPKLLVVSLTTMQGQTGSKSSMYTGTNPSCKDVPGRMGDKAYSCSSCSGLSGGGGVFKSESQSSLTPSISSTVNGLGEYPTNSKI